MRKKFKIAFDFKNSKEYFTRFKITEYTDTEKIPEELKNKKFFIFNDNGIHVQKIGTFLLDFMNADFDDLLDFGYLLEKYFFIDLLFYYKPDILTDCELRKGQKINPYDIDNLDLILSEDELYDFCITFLEDYNVTFNWTKNSLEDIFKNQYYSFLLKITNMLDKNYDLYEELAKKEKNFCAIKDFGKYFSDINISYDLSDFPKKDHLQNCYYADDPSKLVYLFVREFINNKKSFRIQKCKNCNSFFIPKTAHETNYCDEIYQDGKTCKEFVNNMAFGKNYADDPICKKYRNRYKNLNKVVGYTTNLKFIDLYEKYKDEGPKYLEKYKLGKITAKEFENWIDSMKKRK